VGLNPLPVQRPIPIWFGGTVDDALRRAARLGDGWMLNAMTPEKGRERIELLKAYLEENGRSLDQFGLDMRLSPAKFEPSEWGNLVQTWETLGVSYIGINTMDAGFASLSDHLGLLLRFISDYK
jgi:hypothetical protein